MATLDYSTLVQKLYIAYFGRPADTGGLGNMSSALSKLAAPNSVRELLTASSQNPAIAAIINIFSTSDESQALYAGSSSEEFVTAIYEHMLGRAPDAGGLAFWASSIDSGVLTRALAALSIMAGAESNSSAQGKLDAVQLANRVDAASYITSQTWNHKMYGAYSGDRAAAMARDTLSMITADTSVDTQRALSNKLLTNLASSPHNIYIDADTGYSVYDRITNRDKGLIIAGMAAEGTTVELYANGGTTAIGRGVINESTTFRIIVDLPEGTHSIEARVVAGAPPTLQLIPAIFTITIDKTGPEASALPLRVDANAGGGISAAEMAARPEIVADIRGAGLQAGQLIELMLDGKPFYSKNIITLVAEDIARGSVVFALRDVPEGSHALSTRFYDIAGNFGPAGGGTSVMLDTRAPGVPTLSLVGQAEMGISKAQKTAGIAVKVTLDSTNVPGDLLRLTIRSDDKTPDRVTQYVVSAEDRKTGHIMLNIGPSELGNDGLKTFIAQMYDSLGNTFYGNTTTTKLDTVAPTAPTLPLRIAALADGTLRPGERRAGVEVAVDLTGVGATSGDRVEILVDGKPFFHPAIANILDTMLAQRTATITISDYAKWPLSANVTLSARIIDKAGNIGPAGPGISATLGSFDLTLPYDAVSIPANLKGGISAIEKAAGIIVDISLLGTHAAVGDAIRLTVNGVPFATPINHVISAAEVSANLVRLMIPGSLNWGNGDGLYYLRTELSDKVGNSSVLNTEVRIDTVAPGALVAGVNRAGLTRSDTYNGVTFQFGVADSGVMEGDIVNLFINGQPLMPSSIYDISFSSFPTRTVSVRTQYRESAWGADGVKTITAQVTDKAGNVGPIGGSFTFVFDNIGPRLDPMQAIVYTDVNKNNKVDGGDTFLLTFGEKLLPSTSSTSFSVRSGPSYSYLNNSTTFKVAADGLHGTLTLGADVVLPKGVEISVIGFQDPLGNAAVALFTI